MSPTTDKKPAKAFIWIVLLAAAALIVLSWFTQPRAQPSASLPSSTSETQATLSYGQIVLQLDNPSGFQQGQTVQVTSTTDQQTAVGTIVAWDPVLFNATINITTPNLQGNVYFSFFVQVLASAGNQVGIHPDLTAVSNTPYNGASSGATPGTPSSLKMTVSLPGSLVGGSMGNPGTSPTLTAGNVYPFTVPAGLNYPTQSHVQIDDLTPGVHNHYNGLVYSYNGTIINISITSVFGTGSPSATWGLYEVAGPASRIPPFGMTGLQIVQGSGFTFQVTSGCVRDQSDSIDLCLPSTITVDLSKVFGNGLGAVVTASLPGTISSSGTTVTGVSTTFNSSFKGGPVSPLGTNNDLNAQLNALGFTSNSGNSPFEEFQLIGTPTATSAIKAVASDTSLTTAENLGAGAGTSYTRGGTLFANAGASQSLSYVFNIIRNDTTGAIAIAVSSATASGIPDLPAGYSFYRAIGVVNMRVAASVVSVVYIAQPLFTTYASSAGNMPTIVNTNGPDGSYLGHFWQFPGVLSLPVGTGEVLMGGLNFGPQYVVPGNGLSVGAGPALAVALSQTNNTLSGDVNLSNTGTYFDGPSMAQGTSGTWYASGTVTVSGTAGDRIICKLWDGTTVLASTENSSVPTAGSPQALSGILASPAGNIRISCEDATNVTGKIKANATGNAADSTIWGIRIQ